MPTAVLTACLVFFVYLLTLAPDLTWANFGADGGELIAASYTFGVAHPPGYPTYIILGKLFSFLPLGNIAYTYHLFSAVCMAGAVGFVVQTAVHLTENQLIASSTGLTFGLASLVWGQATIAEVYALNALCVAILLWLILAFSSAPSAHSAVNQTSIYAGLFQGLAMTTHPTSFFFLPLTFWQAKHKTPFGLGLLIGLLPFVLLPFLAQSGQVWGEPATLQGWWQLISGDIYRANAFSLASQPYWAERLWGLVWQFTPVGTIAILVGITVWQNKIVWGLVATAVLLLTYTVTYNTPDGIVFAIPLLLIGALLMSPALEKIGALAVLLPITLLISNFSAQNLRNEPRLRDQVIPFLETVPEKSVIVTSGDASIFTFWYFQQVEEMRPDLTFVDQNLLHFTWYRRTLNSWQDQATYCLVSLVDTEPICQWRTELNDATSGN